MGDDLAPPRRSTGAASALSYQRQRRVCAAVVTYQPDDRLSELLTTLAPQVDRLLVVDNGSRAKGLIHRAVALAGGHVIANGLNLGIAAALNQAARFAADSGCQWLLTMDQDSRPSQRMVELLFEALDACPFRETVAIVGSGIVAHGLAEPDRAIRWTEAPSVITSGSIVRLDAAFDVGLFREDFFVDYVDHEFCLRLRRAGYRIIRTTCPTMVHEIGRPERRRLLWRLVTVSNHTALRRYYITRNRIVVWRNFIGLDPRFVLSDFVRALIGEPIKILLFESDRLAKFRSMARGALDGIAGRLGPQFGIADSLGARSGERP